LAFEVAGLWRRECSARRSKARRAELGFVAAVEARIGERGSQGVFKGGAENLGVRAR